MSKKDLAVAIRDQLLCTSDQVFKDIYDPKLIERWKKYRHKLRTMFDNLPSNYNYDNIIWPRTPDDENALIKLAEQGDAEAKKIIKKEKIDA